MPGSILRTSPCTRMQGGAPETRSRSLAPRPINMASQRSRRSVAAESTSRDSSSRSRWFSLAASSMEAPFGVAVRKHDLDVARGISPDAEQLHSLCVRSWSGKQGLEFRIVVNARQVGVDAGPIGVGVAGFFRAANHHQRFGFSAEHTVGASGVVEDVAVTRAQGHGHFRVANGVFFSAKIGVIGGKQNARADILGDGFELPFEDQDFHFAEATSLVIFTKAVQSVGIWDVGVVIVAVSFNGAFDQVSRILEPARSEISATQYVINAFAVGLSFDGLQSVFDGFFVLLKRVVDARFAD